MEQEDNKRKKLLNSTTHLINTATTRDQGVEQQTRSCTAFW